MTVADPRSVACSYIDAVSAHDLTAVTDPLDDGLSATFAGPSNDKSTWIAALGRLLTALVRNDIRDVVNGDQELSERSAQAR